MLFGIENGGKTGNNGIRPRNSKEGIGYYKLALLHMYS